jgi:hypothetical protein
MTDRMRTTRDLDQLDLTRAETAPFSVSEGHRDLFGMAGRWEGPTRTWLDPSAAPSESVTSARVEVILGGRFVRVDYQGMIMGKPHAGEVLIGYEPAESRFTAVWIDSFHMSPGIMVSTGQRSPDGVIAVLGSYAGEGQRWGWRTTLRLESDDRLHIDAFNISPEGREDPAIETRLARIPAR